MVFKLKTHSLSTFWKGYKKFLKFIMQTLKKKNAGKKVIDKGTTFLRRFDTNNQLPAPPLVFGWMADMPAIVYISPDEQNFLTNTLGVTITNTGSNPLVPSGHWGADPPVFKIHFITIPRPDLDDPLPDPGKDSLTYDDLAKDIRVRVVGNGSDRWEVIPGYGSSNPTLVWELRPKTREIFGPQSSVELLIENIRTTLPPFATSLLIQYANLPGYADGTTTLLLQKTPPFPGILSFYAKPSNINLGENTVLNWSAFAVDDIELCYADDGKKVTKSSQCGEIPIDTSAGGFLIKPEKTTVYTMTPYIRQAPGQPAQFSVSVIIPEVTMDVTPIDVGKGDNVTLTWKVTGIEDGYCLLDPPGDHHLALAGEISLNPFILATEGEITTSLSVTGPKSGSLTSGEASSGFTGADPYLIVPITITAFRTDSQTKLAQNTLIVKVMPPHIHSFTADPPGPVDPGTPVKLSWTTQYASSIRLMDSGQSGPFVDNLSTNGVQIVKPMNDTEYTLICDGYQGLVQQPLTVTVNPVRIDDFGFVYGGPYLSYLTWKTSFATSCKLIINNSGEIQVPQNGDYYCPGNPGFNTATLVAEGPHGPVSQSTGWYKSPLD